MSSTTITNSNPYEVAEDSNVSSGLPLRLTSSSLQNKVFIIPSGFASPSSVSESAQTSDTPSEQEDTDATSGSNTVFRISFPAPPPPNTPVDNIDGISVSPESGWTGEYSTSGIEPEHLMARLSTVANKSEEEPEKSQNEDGERSSGESSEIKSSASSSVIRDTSFEEEEQIANLARQAVWRVTPRSVMDSLEIKQVKSGVVTITNNVAQPQSTVLCNIEHESAPEAEEAVVSSPTKAKSTNDAKFIKAEKDHPYLGLMACCVSLFKMGSTPKPQVPVYQPKHATLSPAKSCLKPTTSLHGSDLDIIEEGGPLQSPPAPKPSKGAKVTFDLDETAESYKSRRKRKSKFKSYFNFSITPFLLNRLCSQETQDSSDEEEELDDPDSPFAAQDMEVQRRLERAAVCRDANERTSIIRGALDFLLVVSDRVDTVAADRISDLLSRTGNRCLGSYTGEERDHVNPHQYGNRINPRLYRSKETAMSWSRRRQPRNIIRLGTLSMRDCPQCHS
ncbi:hypothetical protein F52700_10316 [Fusarium sp. NRRL 52700]|nr:hypothetical protein F52700_10316 [Fusarium sp. NRRL 52700]